MKKLLLVAALVLTIGVGSLVVNADSPMRPNIMPGQRNESFSIEDRNDWHNERHSYRQDELKEALKNGEITEVEFKEWEAHFEYMEEFHNKHIDSNSRFMMGGRNGGCRSNGNRRGHGMGMMRGNRR